MTQTGAPCSSPLPPAGTEQVVEGAEGAACRTVHHWGRLYGPRARSQAEQVVPESRWEVMGIHSSGTVSRRGPGFATQRRGAGAFQVVDEVGNSCTKGRRTRT